MNKNILVVIGVLMAVAGGLGLYFGGIPVEREVLSVGEQSLGYTETKSIPEWLSGLLLGLGVALTAFGVFSKK
ncbi:MAG: hypothetical protein R3217_07310 [Gammaproteobacteria bacterium]|nr:hypothetical protein [Gammaproteobacteria bacterium]